MSFDNSKHERPGDAWTPVSIAVILLLASAGAAFSDPTSNRDFPDALIIQAKDHAELQQKWCAANPNVEHIFVLPASLFVDSEQLICDGGPYKLYRLIEHDDPDDFEYFLDPPFANKTRLGCDGKAGRTMQTGAEYCWTDLFETFVETLQRGRDPAELHHRRI